jgi:hypothetical protein
VVAKPEGKRLERPIGLCKCEDNIKMCLKRNRVDENVVDYFSRI